MNNEVIKGVVICVLFLSVGISFLKENTLFNVVFAGIAMIVTLTILNK